MQTYGMDYTKYTGEKNFSLNADIKIQNAEIFPYHMKIIILMLFIQNHLSNIFIIRIKY